tara:strand:- start:33849 stop:34379 length:531 start_codon:yes stop_codon:yes gene_type:complete
MSEIYIYWDDDYKDQFMEVLENPNLLKASEITLTPTWAKSLRDMHVNLAPKDAAEYLKARELHNYFKKFGVISMIKRPYQAPKMSDMPEIIYAVTAWWESGHKNVKCQVDNPFTESTEYIRKDKYDADIDALIQNGISQKQTFDALQKKYDALLAELEAAKSKFCVCAATEELIDE